jgi:hypothetical protein
VTPDLTANIQQQIRDEIVHGELPVFRSSVLSISPWLAASLLQKAIRRGELEWALLAAGTLLSIDPRRFWRRCAVIAAEDVGWGDIDCIYIATACLDPVNREPGKEVWQLASYLVARMALAPKCRAADDLAVVAEYDAALEGERRYLLDLSQQELLEILFSNSKLELKSAVIPFGFAEKFRRNRGNQSRTRPVMSGFLDAGYPQSLIEICEFAIQRTGEVLPAFLLLLQPELQGSLAEKERDTFPHACLCGSVPSWVIDGFTREGRAAFVHFLSGDTPTARWIRANIPGNKRVEFLAGLVFRVESGLVKDRRVTPLTRELRRRADVHSHGSECPNAEEILALLSADIPALNKERANVQ